MSCLVASPRRQNLPLTSIGASFFHCVIEVFHSGRQVGATTVGTGAPLGYSTSSPSLGVEVKGDNFAGVPAAIPEQGFRVVHTPVLPLSPNHVSVYWDDEWDDGVSMMFDGCFDDPKGGRT